MTLSTLQNDQSILESLSPCNYVLAVAPICALPPLSDSLRESESHLNVQRWTLVFVMGACRATGGVWVSYSWVVTQMGYLRNTLLNYLVMFVLVCPAT